MRREAILALVLASAGASGAAAATSAEALRQAAFQPGALQWHETDTQIASGKHAVDHLRVREAAQPLPLTPANPGRAYEVSLVRQWPAAVSFDAGAVAVDVSPHAAVGVIGGDRARGGSAEAGAQVEVSKADKVGQRLEAMGVRDGDSFGQQGRWYLFAAASGRAVGLNMLRGEDGWDRAGLSTDKTSRLVGDAQVGVGWRRGAVQTSIGYIHREVKGEHLLRGSETPSDSLVAVSLSIRRGH